MAKKLTQKQKLTNFLKNGKTLTPVYARRVFKIAKPSARITELRQSGLSIVSTTNTKGDFGWKLA